MRYIMWLGRQGFELQCTNPEFGVHQDATGRACLPTHVEHTAGSRITRQLNLVRENAHYRTRQGKPPEIWVVSPKPPQVRMCVFTMLKQPLR